MKAVALDLAGVMMLAEALGVAQEAFDAGQAPAAFVFECAQGRLMLYILIDDFGKVYVPMWAHDAGDEGDPE